MTRVLGITLAVLLVTACQGSLDGANSCQSGTCKGPSDYCAHNGVCVDDCAGRNCGPSPVLGVDCGACQGFGTCSVKGRCQCAVAPCAGTGYCPQAGACCADVADDARCEPDGICQDLLCRTGEAGELLIDGTTCLLASQPCPSSVVTGHDSNWFLNSGATTFTNVTIRGGAFLAAPAFDGSLGGRLEIDATGTFTLEAGSKISMSGRGYGGGGGGGGSQYCDPGLDNTCRVGQAGGTGYSLVDGERGHDGQEDPLAQPCVACDAQMLGGGAGGAGGGLGGESGQPGFAPASCCPSSPGIVAGDGSGGMGGGPFGGLGGAGNKGSATHQCTGCNGLEAPGQPGYQGGYAEVGSNADTSTDQTILLGSGGGGGGGGAAGTAVLPIAYCGGAAGGLGGVEGGAGHPGCAGGGGGGGGAAGGGAIAIRAREIVVGGAIVANGAGQASRGGGFGAGGGILLVARHKLTLLAGAELRTLGGFDDWIGTAQNGGTIKIIYGQLEGATPDPAMAGRIDCHAGGP